MVQQTTTLPGDGGAAARTSGERAGVLDRARTQAGVGFYRRAWRRFRRNQVGMAGLIITLLIVLFALSAGLIARALGVDYWEGQLRDQFLPPFSPGHPLGTDANGRDLLVRLAYGGRISLAVAVLASVTLLVIGGVVGSVAGYFGGLVDAVAMRVVDVLLCIPSLPLLILVFAVYRPGPYGLALFIAVLGWAGAARLVRAEVLSLRTRDYVDAARVSGASSGWIILRHILPNIVPLLIVALSLALPGLILLEAGLSFLGFGVQIPIPSWGNMLENAREYFARSWHNVFIPGFMIFLTVLAIALVGNGVRDALDPRLNA